MAFSPQAKSKGKRFTKETGVYVTIVEDCALIRIGKPTISSHFMLSGANILKLYLTGRLKISRRDADQAVVIELSPQGKQPREPKSTASAPSSKESAVPVKIPHDPSMSALARFEKPFD
jgi:hypothetical protein